MLRVRHFVVAMAAIFGCSKGPNGGGPPRVTQPTIEEHTARFFPIASGPHAVECNACHGTSSTFREFDCLTCHAPLPTNSRHKGMPGYGYASASCYGCHRDGKAGSNIDHSSFFPVATGDVHALGAPAVHVGGTIGCASCHTNAAERAQIDCTSCHSQTAMAPLHLAVPDLKFTTASETSALCVKCHPDSAAPIAVANHAPFKVSSGSIHYQKPCLTCHAEPRTDKAWAQDFKQQACIACHDQPIDRVVSKHEVLQINAVPADVRSCLGCHRSGEPATDFDHVFFPIAAGDVHAVGTSAVHVAGSIACRSCHTSGESTTVDCTSCHNPADQVARHSGLIGLEPGTGPPIWSGTGATPGGATASCLLCHGLGGLQRVATHAQTTAQPAGFPIAGGNHFQSCEQCHTATKTDPRLTNPELDFAVASCANCHSQAKDSTNTKHAAFGVDVTTASTATCLGCHSDGGMATSFTHPAFPTTSTDIHALGAPAVHVDGTIRCESCHIAAANLDYAPVDCTTCHTQPAMAPLHVAVADLTFTTPTGTSQLCLKCHAESQVPIAVTTTPPDHVPPVALHSPFNVSLGAVHYQKPCLTCHATARTDKPWAQDFKERACIGCHDEPIDRVVSRHAAIQITVASADTASCLTCHPSGGAASFNHPLFPITQSDVHALGSPAVHLTGAIACTSCHTGAAGPAGIDCATCHAQPAMAPLHVAVSDLKYTTPGETSGLCLRCHAESQVPTAVVTTAPNHAPPVAPHTPFDVSTRAIHYQMPCLTCHGTIRTDKPWAADFKQQACSGCHSEAIDQVVSRHALLQITAVPADTASCLSCHPNGEPAMNFNHVFFPVALGDVHALGADAVHLPGAISCKSCHTTGASTSVDCTVCHGPADQNTRHSGLVGPEPANATPLWSGTGAAPGGESANCLLCHANGALQRVATHAQTTAQPAGFSIAGGNHFQSCEQCHTATKTDPRLTNPQLDFAVASCANCHSQAKDSTNTKHAAFGVDVTTASTTTCLGCHSDGGMATSFSHPGFPVASTDIHALGAPALHVSGAIRCESCHSAATSLDYAPIDCTSCHSEPAMAPLHVAVADLKFTTATETSGLCLKCHAESQVPIAVATTPPDHIPPVAQHAPFNVSSSAVHYQKPCLTCHATARVDKPWAQDFKERACIGCHAEPIDRVVSRHAAIQISVVPSDTASCLTCHPSGGAASFNHPLFPITQTDVHALGTPALHLSGAIACTSCHTGAAGPAGIDCATCHAQPVMAPLHVAVSDLKFTTPGETSGLCLKCHAASWVSIVVVTMLPSHVPPVRPPAPFDLSTGPIQHQMPCLTCHATIRTDRPWAADFKQQACSGCHSEAIDQVVSRHALLQIAAVPTDTASCLSCHSNGEPATSFNHIFFPVALGDVHALGADAVHLPGAISCKSCHTTGASTSVDCTVCHGPADQNARHSGLVGPEPGNETPLWSGTGAAPGGETANCLLCHANGALQRVATHAQTTAQPA